MKPELFKLALDVRNSKNNDRNVPVGAPVQFGMKKINGRAMSYTERYRDQWVKPEYNLEEIQIAQDTDSYIFKSIQLKANRFALAGWEFTSLSEDRLRYVKKRIREIEAVSGIPFDFLLFQTARDLIRFSNCIWVKVRNVNASTGKKRSLPTGKEVDPVAGYFILPFETLEFKYKINGELQRVKQLMPSGRSREFAPEDIIHFVTNKNPGFTMGTPELGPVLDDVSLLRRIEELVQDLLETSIFPLYQWSIGSDSLPERVGPDGVKETDVVKKTIEYMPAGGMFVTDHRHKISAIGAEGRALRIEGYLEYFKKRVFSGLGVSSVDMGEGDTANRATAQSLSKTAIQHVEALHLYVKLFIDKFVINELLLEGTFGENVFDDENIVELKFGTVDKEENTKLENQVIQLFANKLITETEARKRLRLNPLSEEMRENSYFKLYEEPLAMMKIGMPSTDLALAQSPNSSISEEGIKRNEEREAQKRQGANANSSSTGAQRASAAASRPSNQHGTRTSPKFDNYIELDTGSLVNLELLDKSFNDGLLSVSETISLNDEYLVKLEELKSKCVDSINKTLELSKKKIAEFEKEGVSSDLVLKSLSWRYDNLINDYSIQAFELGVDLGKLEISE